MTSRDRRYGHDEHDATKHTMINTILRVHRAIVAIVPKPWVRDVDWYYLSMARVYLTRRNSARAAEFSGSFSITFSSIARAASI